MNIAVLVSGGGTNLQAIIDQIENQTLHGVTIVMIISSSQKAYAIERAKAHGIPSCVISKKDFSDFDTYDEAMNQALSGQKIDLVVLAGFLSLLGPKVVRQFSNRIINIHPALIPSFCGHGMYGIKPHEAALARGVKLSGATVHFVNENYDEGPILLQKCIEVFDDDTPQSLQLRIMKECEQVILPAAIQLIADQQVYIKDNRAYISSSRTVAGEGIS
ncbi:MAG: phosphoribosylglycinamide formyltransferase [Eubacteriales bacterium]